MAVSIMVWVRVGLAGNLNFIECCIINICNVKIVVATIMAHMVRDVFVLANVQEDLQRKQKELK